MEPTAATNPRAAIARGRRKPFYRTLWGQVLIGVAIAIVLGVVSPSTGRGDEAARRRLHPPHHNGDQPGRLLHDCGGHRRHGKHEEGRPRRREGADLLRGCDQPGADPRPGRRRRHPAGRRVQRRSRVARRQRGRQLRRRGEGAISHRIPPQYHSELRNRCIRERKHPQRDLCIGAVRIRACVARTRSSRCWTCSTG